MRHRRLPGLTYANGLLQGVTSEGGNGDGRLYTVNPRTGVATAVIMFSNAVSGAQPNGDLLYKSGAFFGVIAQSAGQRSCGGVFKFVP